MTPDLITPSKPARHVDPMSLLRTQTAALEEAIALALAEPSERAVHRLRTTTRRLEAQLLLFRLLAKTDPVFALDRPHERKLAKLLTEIRKTAGHVRDLDVQAAAIQAEAALSTQQPQIQPDTAAPEAAEPAPQPTTPQPKAAEPTTLEPTTPQPLRAEADKLLRALSRRRAQEAAELTATLRGHARKTGPKLQKLLTAMAAAEKHPIPARDVAELARTWFAKQQLADLDKATDRELHEVRKSAKLARYLAESAGLNKLGARFEAIQEAGGAWHDNFALAALARKRLGKRSPLAVLFERREDAALRAFRSSLSPD